MPSSIGEDPWRAATSNDACSATRAFVVAAARPWEACSGREATARAVRRSRQEERNSGPSKQRSAYSGAAAPPSKPSRVPILGARVPPALARIAPPIARYASEFSTHGSRCSSSSAWGDGQARVVRPRRGVLPERGSRPPLPHHAGARALLACFRRSLLVLGAQALALTHGEEFCPFLQGRVAARGSFAGVTQWIREPPPDPKMEARVPTLWVRQSLGGKR